MNEFFIIGGKLLASLILIIIIFRLLGRKSLKQFTPIDFLISVVMADLVVELSLDPKMTIWHLIGLVILWALLTFILDYMKYKSPTFKEITSGKPLVIIQDGRIIRDTLDRERMTEEELAAKLREQGYFDYRNIRLAVIEINGTVSVDK